MGFTKIVLTGYRNYESQTFHFDHRIVGICGLNGKGKTNLLDAINYICFTKSYFSKTDTLNIFFGAEGFRLEAELQNAMKADQSSYESCVHLPVSFKKGILS